MSKTRKIDIVDRPFVCSDPGVYAIRCPRCEGWIGIGERPFVEHGFRIFNDGTVQEMQVCMNRIGVGGNRIADFYCDWEGFVRLIDTPQNFRTVK